MARITADCARLIATEGSALLAPATIELEPLTLPEPRREWSVTPGSLRRPERHSATSLGSMIGCPLRWTFQYPAGLYSSSVASLPAGPLLNGRLGQRLIAELHADGTLSGEVEGAVHRVFDRLLREEAAVLLVEGMTSEVDQLRSQLLSSVQALVEILEASKLHVIGVEIEVEVPWRDGKLSGRLDLLLSDPDGNEAVVDLKWGRSKYWALLEKGQATQLAVYVSARRLATGAGELLPAGYFSLANGELLTTQTAPFVGARPINGPGLDETWRQLERTVDLVQQLLDQGESS